jgi:hypothetical protein
MVNCNSNVRNRTDGTSCLTVQFEPARPPMSLIWTAWFSQSPPIALARSRIAQGPLTRLRRLPAETAIGISPIDATRDYFLAKYALVSVRDIPINGTGTRRRGQCSLLEEGGHMPRFYFHICDDEGMSRDDEGTDLLDLEAAREEARASARDLISNYMKTRQSVNTQTLQIADAGGNVLEVMGVRDVLN